MEQQLLPQLNINVNTDTPVTVARAQANATAPISDVASTLLNIGTNAISYDQQQKAIKQAYTDAMNGKFSTIDGLTSGNRAYNEVINNIAPSIVADKANSNLKALQDSILYSKDFNPTTAVQQYADGSKKIIDAYLQNTPTKWNGQVGLLLNKQALQYGDTIKTQATKSVFNQQIADSLTAANNYMQSITEAAKSGFTGQAQDLNAQRNNLIDNALTAGLISPETAYSFRKQGSDEIKLQDALRSGTPIADDDQLEARRLSLYNQQQRDVEVAQLQNGFSYKEYLERLSNGEHPNIPIQGFTDEQIAKNKAALYKMTASQTAGIEVAKLEGQYTNLFKSLSAVDRFNLQIGDVEKLPEQYQQFANSFASLPNQVQNKIFSNLRTYDTLIKTSTVDALSLPKIDFTQPANSDLIKNRAAQIATAGANVSKNIVTISELSQLSNIANNSIAQANQLIEQHYGEFAPIVKAKISDGLEPKGVIGYSVTNIPTIPSTMKDTYLNHPQGTNLLNTKWVNTANLNSFLGGNYFDALSKLKPDQQTAVIGYVNGVVAGSNNTIKPADVFSNSFDIYNGQIVAKGDGTYLGSPAMQNLISSKGIKNFGNFIYYPKNDTYGLLDNNGNLIPNASYSGAVIRKAPLDFGYLRAKINQVSNNPSLLIKNVLPSSGGEALSSGIQDILGNKK